MKFHGLRLTGAYQMADRDRLLRTTLKHPAICPVGVPATPYSPPVNDLPALFAYLLDCLAYLASYGIYHTAISKDVIVRTGPTTPIYLTDFSHATIYGPQQWAGPLPAHHPAPELVEAPAANDSAYDSRIDVWALGCVFFTFVTGRDCPADPRADVLTWDATDCPPVLKLVLSHAVDTDQERRYTAQELLQLFTPAILPAPAEEPDWEYPYPVNTTKSPIRLYAQRHALILRLRDAGFDSAVSVGHLMAIIDRAVTATPPLDLETAITAAISFIQTGVVPAGVPDGVCQYYATIDRVMAKMPEQAYYNIVASHYWPQYGEQLAFETLLEYNEHRAMALDPLQFLDGV